MWSVSADGGSGISLYRYQAVWYVYVDLTPGPSCANRERLPPFFSRVMRRTFVRYSYHHPPSRVNSSRIPPAPSAFSFTARRRAIPAPARLHLSYLDISPLPHDPPPCNLPRPRQDAPVRPLQPWQRAPLPDVLPRPRLLPGSIGIVLVPRTLHFVPRAEAEEGAAAFLQERTDAV